MSILSLFLHLSWFFLDIGGKVMCLAWNIFLLHVDGINIGDKGLFNTIYEFGKRNLYLLSSYLALNSIIFHLSNPSEKYTSIHPPQGIFIYLFWKRYFSP